MNTISETYINALLADASYVNQLAGKSGATLIATLTERMTVSQAKYITDNFEVMNQELSATGGFDATVWRRKSDGRVFVSMRGTQGLTDIADDINLAASGLANTQLASMVNWWLRETTPTGQMAKQIKWDPLYQPDSNSSMVVPSFIAVADAAGTGSLGSVNYIDSLNGHSLGGYMAAAFTRLFGNQWFVGHVTTFNSAGFNNLQTSAIQNGFTQIQSLIGSSLGRTAFATETQQDNFFAQNGINVTTNSWADYGFTRVGFHQYGNRQGLYQEDLLTGGLAAPINNHAMYKQTDLLALGAAMEKLDSSMTFDKLNLIIKAGSNDMKASYEGVLDSLRKMIQGTTYDGYATAIGDASGNADSRAEFHENLADLQSWNDYKSLIGKVKLSATAGDTSLVAKAKTSFSDLVALQTLSPVVIEAASPAQQASVDALLGAQNLNLYANWQADKALIAAGKAPKNFSDAYLNDRQALLQNLQIANINDTAALADTITLKYGLEKGMNYEDRETNTKINVQGIIPMAAVGKVIFGGKGADQITGSDQADRLYGGDEWDTINGGKGNDYIEGNAGNDTLDGGTGVDTLLGGSGFDTYKVGKDERVVIIDSDGGGEVQLLGTKLTGGTLQAILAMASQSHASTKSSTHGLRGSNLAANETTWRIAA
jgi:trimeric autotransporter adhesin